MGDRKAILLVEDDKDLCDINRRILERKDYNVHAVQTLGDAREYLAAHDPDVILLDVMLPDGDGVSFCGEIRDATNAHIIFLTSRSEHKEKVKGLLVGGDDYITKPYHAEEMLARVTAAIRRREMEPEKPSARTISRGLLTLETDSNCAFFNGREMGLTQRQFLMLKLLLEQYGTAIPKNELFEKVWNKPMVEDSRALWTQISRLKRKLEDYSCGKVTISASRGEGYQLEMQ